MKKGRRTLDKELMKLSEKIDEIKQNCPAALPYVIIKSYMQIQDPDKHTTRKFREWLCNGHDSEEKEHALKLVFDEFIQDKFF